jgi:hypothetical protein
MYVEAVPYNVDVCKRNLGELDELLPRDGEELEVRSVGHDVTYEFLDVVCLSGHLHKESSF